ncbi:RidA family protein [Arthrobacter sp. NPDC089319]|uniref:RidA family protein n=1 Tax=Arthrobacter sp. NPDC089319 TaxID=3155915 RepID=UPI0034245F25
MSSSTETRLQQLGIALPKPHAGAAMYVPWVKTGNLLFTSGQLPLKDGRLKATGLLGEHLDLAEGQEAARWCAVNLLSQLRAALGDLDRVQRLIKITVFVAAANGFNDHHLVANGASELLADVFGFKGDHARSAVGVAGLPMNAPVEIEAVVEFANANSWEGLAEFSNGY